MESLLIILIGLAAAAAVAYPLVRTTGGSTDPHLDPDPRVVEATDAKSAGAVGTPDVEQEIARFREALRHGTVCSRCRAANRAGSRFCSDCGAQLSAASGAAGG